MPPSGGGHKPIISAGHQVIYDLAAGVYGNGTSSTTATSNSIIVNGELVGHPTTPWSLTCVGTLAVAAGGSILFDQSAGGSGTLILNSGGTSGQHGFVTLPGAGSCNVVIRGIDRTRNTTLSSAVSSGSTIQVTDSTNWAVGDVIIIASDTDDPARSLRTTIASGSSPNWTLAAPINFPRAAGCRVGNFSSNMVVSSATPSSPATMSVQSQASGSITPANPISGVRFVDIGSTSGWAGSTAAQFVSLALFTNSTTTISKCAHEWTHSLTTQTNSALFGSSGLSNGYAVWDDCAGYISGTSGNGIGYGVSASGSHTNCVIYRAPNGIVSTSGAGAFDGNVVGGAIWASTSVGNAVAGNMTLTDCEHHSAQFGWVYSSGFARYVRGSLSCQARLLSHSANAITGVYSVDTTFSGVALTADNTAGSNIPAQLAHGILQSVNGVASDCRDISYYRVATTDALNTFKETFSVKIQPKVANTAITYTFKIPATAGVAQTINPALQFDATYGTATPPTISLSGQGVTDSWTCPATAGQWFSHAFTFTPTSNGDIAVTVTVQSTSTAGFVWLGGIYHYPMIQSVRQWGYQWLPQAALITDTRITLTEAAALALPVVSDHTAHTITITGQVTPSEALQAQLVSLAQASNNAIPVHVTGDGTTFTTTYTVVLSGAGSVSGVYTDAGGVSCYLTLSGLTATESVVLIRNQAGATYSITTATGSTFTLSLPPGNTGLWSWKVVRYGYQTQTGTFSPSAGASSAVVPSIPDTGITQPSAATVAGYLSLNTPGQLYDYCAYYETTSSGILLDRIATKSGSACDLGAYGFVIDATASSVFDVTGNIVTVASPAFIASSVLTEVSATGAPLSLLNGATISVIYTDSVSRWVYVKLPALVSGTKVRVYDVTNSTQLSLTTTTGTGYTLTTQWHADALLLARAAHIDKQPLELSTILTSSGAFLPDIQDDDVVYAGNGIDGSTVTELVDDDPNIQIDLTNNTTVQRIYAFMHHYETTDDGISGPLYKVLSATDPLNYRIDVSRADMQLDNVGSSPVQITGGNLTRSDGSNVISPLSNSIQFEPGKAYQSVTDFAGIAAAIRSNIALELSRLDAAVSTRLAASSYIAPDNAPIPTAAENASAVRAELATELSRVDVAVSTRLAASSYTAPNNTPVPTAAENASAVRAELATELSRVDIAVSSRLASDAVVSVDPAVIAESVWASPDRTLTSTASIDPSSIAVAVWTNPERSLTISSSTPSAEDIAQAVKQVPVTGNQIPGSLGHLVQETAARVIGQL